MIPNIAAAMLHGAVDPSYPSKTAIDAVAPKDPLTFTESEAASIKAISADIEAKIAKEVNRIEAAASLMLSHFEGQYESFAENLKLEFEKHQTATYQATIFAYALAAGSGAFMTAILFILGRSFV